MTAAYVDAVLTLYLDLPDTPLRPSPLDQSLARKLHEQSVPLPLVESALLLATLRRFSKPSDRPPLPKDPFARLLPARHRRTPAAAPTRRLPRLPPPQALPARPAACSEQYVF